MLPYQNLNSSLMKNGWKYGFLIFFLSCNLVKHDARYTWLHKMKPQKGIMSATVIEKNHHVFSHEASTILQYNSPPSGTQKFHATSFTTGSIGVDVFKPKPKPKPAKVKPLKPMKKHFSFAKMFGIISTIVGAGSIAINPNYIRGMLNIYVFGAAGIGILVGICVLKMAKSDKGKVWAILGIALSLLGMMAIFSQTIFSLK